MGSFETTIDDLPDEMFCEIFKYLNPTALLNCRQTNRRWKSISDITRVRQVIISNQIDEFRELWFHNVQRPINYMDAISFHTFRSSARLFNLKQNLLKLHIGYAFGASHFSRSLDFDYSILNDFVNLQELDLLLQRSQKVDQMLDLPNLKRFRLQFLQISASLHRVHLIAPKLVLLNCNLSMIIIQYPTSIKQCWTDGIRHSGFNYYFQLNAMENLECLRFSDPFVDYANLEGVLSDFPKLKELHLNLSSGMTYSNREVMKDDLLNILREKLVLERDEFKLWLLGVELTNEEMIELFFLNKLGEGKLDYLSSEVDLAFQTEHYVHLNGDLSAYQKANYNRLIDLVGGQIPADYLSKFAYIRYVQVNDQVTNPQHLTWFLGRLNYLKSLNLTNTSLSQPFYDDLPAVCNLSDVFISESNPELSIDFNFILKFKLLEHFHTNRSYEQLFDLAISSFNNLKHLKLFEFNNDQDQVYISRNYESRKFYFNYKLNACEFKRLNLVNFRKTKLDLDELITFYNQLKDDEFSPKNLANFFLKTSN